MAIKPDVVLRQLDRGLHVPLTLILTEDGSPQILDHWLARRKTVWTRHVVSEADNAPGTFLVGLQAALRPLVPALCLAHDTATPDPLDATVELLNGLMTAEEHFAILLEEYQAITAPAVHAMVALMVDYPPPRMHLYLVSRTVPPLPIPRLRVRQQLVEIDLRQR
jgi:LuxR family maltose regulon positive regulatory protein